MTWPPDNYSSRIRGFDAPRSAAVALSVPRPTYTYFAEIDINPEAVVSNLPEAFKNGRFLAGLQKVTRPTLTFTTEDLRCYNVKRVVPTRFDVGEFSMSFFNDSLSFVAGLLKASRNFYSYMAKAKTPDDIGDGTGADSRRGSQLSSVGLRVRRASRHFFREIVIYDLGPEPTAVNVFHLINPMITASTIDGLDYSQTAVTNATATLKCEGYYEFLGRSIDEFPHLFDPLGTSRVAPVERRDMVFVDLDRAGFVESTDFLALGEQSSGTISPGDELTSVDPSDPFSDLRSLFDFGEEDFADLGTDVGTWDPTFNDGIWVSANGLLGGGSATSSRSLMTSVSGWMESFGD